MTEGKEPSAEALEAARAIRLFDDPQQPVLGSWQIKRIARALDAFASRSRLRWSTEPTGLVHIGWILDFCSGCGTMLEGRAPDGLPETLNVCPKCGLDVAKRSARCQGHFAHSDAMLLRKALGFVKAAVLALALFSTQAVAQEVKSPDERRWDWSLANGTITNSPVVRSCKLIFGQPPILTIDACERTITAAPDVKVDEAAAKIIDALRPYLANMSRGP